jgi:hypothetical protein
MVGMSTLVTLEQTPTLPPPTKTQSFTLYLVVVRMAGNVRKCPEWEGIAVGGRCDVGSFTQLSSVASV